MSLFAYAWSNTSYAWSAEQKKDEMLMLTQSCPGLHIESTVHVSSKGMRMQNKEVTFVTKPPLWDITVLNSKVRLYYLAHYDKGIDNLRTLTVALPDELTGERGWQRSKGSPILDVTANLWVKSSKHSHEPLKIWTLPEPGLAPCAKLLGAIYGLPSPGGEIPLKVTFFGNPQAAMPQRHYEGKATFTMQQWLTTKQIRRVPYSEDLFTIPKGYKITKSVSMVMRAIDPMKDNFIIKDLMKNPEALFESQ